MHTWHALQIQPRRTATLVASATVLAALLFVLYRLAAAPIHGVATVEDCDTAYAKAHTRMDSVAVDFTSIGNQSNHRCGYVPRTVAQQSGPLR